jgi:hypothetical protein
MMRSSPGLTWDGHGLATHDKDDPHRTELLHTQPLSHFDGEAKLDDEDGAEKADADGCYDVSGTL